MFAASRSSLRRINAVTAVFMNCVTTTAALLSRRRVARATKKSMRATNPR